MIFLRLINQSCAAIHGGDLINTDPKALTLLRSQSHGAFDGGNSTISFEQNWLASTG